MFIKAPGQTTGEIRDDSAQTIDVLPSIVDLLDIETNWEFDGHSLYDGSQPPPPRVSPMSRRLDIAARRRAEEFPHGDDWTGLAAVGDNGDLVGRAVAELPRGRSERVTGRSTSRTCSPTAHGRRPDAVRL